ncbi:MAG: hypothetical protein WCJ14_09020 [Verrucomicrobiota bacterium]
MSRLSSIALSTALIGAGALAWAVAGRPLLANPDLDTPLNALGINRSPYGEVLAMALQGPIDTFFDAGVSGGAPEPKDAADPPPAATPRTLNARFETLLISFDKALAARTNPKVGSDAMKRHLRRQAEDKLRFAYQLDPAHYGNYNSLHFFLTEPELGTRPQLTAAAAKLAEDTIQYCLKQDHDPRPALTAAAAATNILELMFNDQHNATPKYDTTQMRQCLNLIDHCLARYDEVAQQWDQSKQWNLLSPQRVAECEERRQFITKIRDTQNQTLLHLEHNHLAPQASN